MKPIHNVQNKVVDLQMVVSHHKVNDLNETNSQRRLPLEFADVRCESSQS